MSLMDRLRKLTGQDVPDKQNDNTTRESTSDDDWVDASDRMAD